MVRQWQHGALAAHDTVCWYPGGKCRGEICCIRLLAATALHSVALWTLPQVSLHLQLPGHAQCVVAAAAGSIKHCPGGA